MLYRVALLAALADVFICHARPAAFCIR